MAARIPATRDEVAASEFMVHPQDPIYDALWYIKHNGLQMSVRPDGKLKLSPANKIPDELKDILQDRSIVNRLKMRVGKPQDFSDKMKYFYQEYAYPMTPWEPFVNPKATTAEKTAALLMMPMEFLNPEASKVGEILTQKGESLANKYLLRGMSKNQPLKEWLAKKFGQVTPKLVRGGIVAGGAGVGGAIAGEPFGESALTGLEMEGTRDLIESLPAPFRFANRYSIQASQDLHNSESAALAILHHADFDPKNKSGYYAKWLKKTGRSHDWVTALKQMSWDEFRDTFGHRYEEEMNALADQMFQESRNNAAMARKAFNDKYGIKSGSNPPIKWTEQMQKDWQNVKAAEDKVRQAYKDRKIIDKNIRDVRTLNDKTRWGAEGEKKKGQIDLFDTISDRKEQIRRTLAKNSPQLVDQYDFINHDYEQARTLFDFARDDNIYTPTGKDLNTQYIQQNLRDRAGFYREKLGNDEFDELSKAFRMPPGETQTDQPGFLRRSGSGGGVHMRDGGVSGWSKMPIPTREHPVLTQMNPSTIRPKTPFGTRAAFTLLDPHTKEIFDRLNFLAPEEKKDQNASGQ